MSEDLTGLMKSWPYEPNHTMRIIVAESGRSVLQVRLPLGIEQYELEGRPDGKRPHGFETYVAYVEERLKRYIIDNGSDLGFHIGPDDGSILQMEGALFYYRYLILFQMQYFDLVIRDCDHNLHLSDLLEKYCESEESRNAVLQYRPYIIRMRASAKALSLEPGDTTIEEVVNRAIEEIETVEDIDTPAFQFEKIRSINYLKSLLRKVSGDGTDEKDILQSALEEAIEREDYEEAAQLRDRLLDIGGIDGVVDKDI